MARRRWIADEWNEKRAALLGTQARHLALVLRARPGMRYDVVTGGEVWSATVSAISVERVEFLLDTRIVSNTALPLTLLLAIFKFDRVEWAIEKATELGVLRIAPVVARRTEKHLAQAAAARAERWRRIAGEAAKQSRRADVPTIDAPVALEKAVTVSRPGLRILLAESERLVTLSDALTTLSATVEPMRESTLRAQTVESVAEEHVTLAVGPEGGWTSEEEQLFAGAGWQPVTLGPRILRAETAAIAGLAVAASALLG